MSYGDRLLKEYLALHLQWRMLLTLDPEFQKEKPEDILAEFQQKHKEIEALLNIVETLPKCFDCDALATYQDGEVKTMYFCDETAAYPDMELPHAEMVRAYREVKKE